jgi:hypothetical protein
MDPQYYGLIEMTLSFGAVLVFCLWQLYQVRKPTKPKPGSTDMHDRR